MPISQHKRRLLKNVHLRPENTNMSFVCIYLQARVRYFPYLILQYFMLCLLLINTFSLNQKLAEGQ